MLIVVLAMPFKVNAADDITGNTHEKEIRKVMELGIMSGYGDGIFKPGNQVTRAQFAKMIAKTLELPDVERPSVFEDVEETHGSKNYIMAAVEVGIIKGDNGKFMPNNPISRQHMAVMMERALTYKEIKGQSASLTFDDANLINKDYRDAASVTVYYGIFKGDGNVFNPLRNATRGQGAAVISRFLEVLETGKPVEDSTPSTPEEPKPEKPDPPKPVIQDYSVATVSDLGKVTVVKTYETYQAAEKAATGNQVVMYKNDIIKMAGGIGYSKGTATSVTANVYTDATMRSAFTYVPADYEVEYMNATEKYVQVKLAGKVGYMKQENLDLVPWHATQGRSYYSAVNGDLVHNIYLEKGKRYVNYVAGKAPAFMTPGKKYYSWDGLHFNDDAGKSVGQAAQYFQYLPLRSKTNYTAKEIDAYIMKQLQAINNTTTLYSNATKKSKLIGLGTYLKEVEAKHNVNAMAILSLAQHESAYGMSDRAQKQNNLFGLRVFDNNPDNIEYLSVEKNIDSLIDNYFNKNYIPPTAPYAYGAAFGNKAQGMNVKYASDPFWGAKAAGHWYRADKLMGGKDFAKHRLAVTNTTGLNVRSGASTSNQLLFTYRYQQMPVIVVGDVANSPWKKIISDDRKYGEVFVHGQYLTELNVVK